MKSSAPCEYEFADFESVPCRIHLISLRMGHHAGPSGYDRVADAIDSETIVTRMPSRLLPRVVGRLLDPFAKRSGSVWYHRANMLAELSAAGRWASERHHLFHFLYGENSYRYLGVAKRLARRGNWLVATYHTPSWRVRELVTQRKAIGRLDAVIVVSRSQTEYFNELLGTHRVHFVPHGVDTDYFSPAPTSRYADRFRLITVGRHLRDFDALLETTKVIYRTRPDVEFVVVSQPQWLQQFRHLPNVSCHSNVPDAELRELYRSAHALFLPLVDCTANNALLEGMACGLPVITTDLQGVRDYVPSTCAVLTPKHDVEALVDAVVRARDGVISLANMGHASRQASLGFSWDRVSAATVDVYRNVVAA